VGPEPVNRLRCINVADSFAQTHAVDDQQGMPDPEARSWNGDSHASSAAIERTSSGKKTSCRCVSMASSAAVDVEMESPHKPPCKLSECQAVTHRHRAGTDKAFTACVKHQPFHGPAHRVRAIQNPHGLVLLGVRLERTNICTL
jgi:hypothetical protein